MKPVSLILPRMTIALLIALSIGVMTSPGRAAGTSSFVVETVEYDDVLEDESGLDPRAEAPAPNASIGRFGPFVVVDATTVELRGTIEHDTPLRFRAMMAAFPGIKLMRMVECPGSEDDDANLMLARMVRKAGISTVVPSYGSVRSGGVDLFFAGVTRTIVPGAQFGVHSWRDDEGHEATDFAADDPVHGDYIRYYIEMGMQPEQARSFYSFTNRVAPSSGVHYMTGRELSDFGLASLN
jgi:hypothetical protein